MSLKQRRDARTANHESHAPDDGLSGSSPDRTIDVVARKDGAPAPDPPALDPTPSVDQSVRQHTRYAAP
jgi:hypothetical protein